MSITLKKNIKKTLKIAGILFLILGILQIFGLGMRIYSVQTGISKLKLTWFDYTLNAIEIALSLLTGILYLIQLSKNSKDIVKQNKLFFGLCMANVFNSLAGWVISFWVQIANEQAKSLEFSFIDTSSETATNVANNVVTTQDGEIVIDEGGYEVLHTETLTTRLEELSKLRSKNLISQEEYIKLRQEEIDKFLN